MPLDGLGIHCCLAFLTYRRFPLQELLLALGVGGEVPGHASQALGDPGILSQGTEIKIHPIGKTCFALDPKAIPVTMWFTFPVNHG